jgi:hypothetical protein
MVVSYIVSKTNSFEHYIGPYLDDVNLRMGYVSCGDETPDGNNSSPIDPRTGQPLTEESWQSYWAAFLEQVDAALPSSARIAHNAPWYFLPLSDPEHVRQVQATDYVELEFGWNELDSVSGDFGWSAKMAYVDWVHSLGAHVISQEYLGGQTLNEQQIRYGLANYFLFTDGEDFFSLFENSAPNDDWTLYGSTLGEPLGPRYQTGGVWRRDYQYGYVTVDPAAKIGTIVAPDS